METQNLQLHHIIREPKTPQENPPVLFLLHGHGSNEEDLFSFASELPEELFIISARAPHLMMPGSYTWYDIQYDAELGKQVDYRQAVASRDGIYAFIQTACQAYNLDDTKISLLGFSQGAILSLAISQTYPKAIQNVIALSGYGEKEIITSLSAEHYAHQHLYLSHGTEDQVIPFDLALESKALLNALKIDYVFETYPVGHNVSMPNFLSLKKWLATRLKN